jgi:ectoine hydroxylase-related dioxygenase (phytanoyl-CoA dioxygenase family)
MPGEFDPDQEIKVGAVLDAIGRGKYSLTQCQNFLKMIYDGTVKDGDIILFPAWLQHSTMENATDEERISIAFNINFIKASSYTLFFL